MRVLLGYLCLIARWQGNKKIEGLIEVQKSIERRFGDARLRKGLASFARLPNCIGLLTKIRVSSHRCLRSDHSS